MSEHRAIENQIPGNILLALCHCIGATSTLVKVIEYREEEAVRARATKLCCLPGIYSAKPPLQSWPHEHGHLGME